MRTIVTITAPSSRRAVLRSALLGAAALGVVACTVSHSGTVTTATLDVNRLLTDGQAIVSALDTALLIPGVAALLGANLVTAEAALAAAGAAMAELKTLAGNSVSVSIDTARIQALAASLLSDARTVLSLLHGLSPATAVTSRLALLVAASTTLMPLMEQAAGLPAAMSASIGPAMTEADALRIAQAG